MIWQHISFCTIYYFWGEILPLGDQKKRGAYNHYKRFYEKIPPNLPYVWEKNIESTIF
jgi:hypothetical protein